MDERLQAALRCLRADDRFEQLHSANNGRKLHISEARELNSGNGRPIIYRLMSAFDGARASPSM